MAFSIRTNLLSPVSASEFQLKTDQLLTVDEGKIVNILPASDGLEWDIDLRNCLAIPGLIDLHVHLSQYGITGLYRDSLLPWLNEVVFPEESKSADYDFASALAEDFIQGLYRAGTTTAVIYTAPYMTACEAAFEAASLHNLRAFIGMTLMDQNSPETLLQKTKQAMQDCENLIKEYHRPGEGLEFIFTPRFAPTCSMKLMRWIGDFAREHGIWIQTHLSENRAEIVWVKELFGLESYTDVYEKAGLLSDKTLLAHCIHLSDNELKQIKSSGSKVVHCPDSNFFLRSGQFPLARIREHDIPFALGSDVGAGTSLNMLYHAKMFDFRQTEILVTPAEAFYRITLGSAKLLGLENSVGSLEIGKDADLVLLKLPEPELPLTNDIVSRLIFTGNEWRIEQVYTKGIRKV